MSIIEKLTEGIVNRDMRQEGEALLNKWSQTGLLEGLDGQKQQNMAVLFGETKQSHFLKSLLALPVVELKVSLLLHSQSFVVYSPDLSLTILLVFSRCHCHLV